MMESDAVPRSTSRSYEQFVGDHGDRLRRALAARYGPEIGGDAYRDALAVAWQRWAEIGPMVNPVGYLYRVGQSKARPALRWARRRRPFVGVEVVGSRPDRDELLTLFAELAKLPDDQRTAVLMVKSYGYSHAEVAEVLQVSATKVNNLVHRGTTRLRTVMVDEMTEGMEEG